MDKGKTSVRGHILLVDDGKINRLLGKKILKNLSCEVTEAINGLEAIQILKSHPLSNFDLILMDLEMPELGGLQASTQIREERLSYAPIVALSAHPLEETRFLCKAAKMNGYIEKPVTVEKLAMVLDKMGL